MISISFLLLQSRVFLPISGWKPDSQIILSDKASSNDIFLEIDPVFGKRVAGSVLSKNDDEKKIVMVLPAIKSRPTAATLFSGGIFLARMVLRETRDKKRLIFPCRTDTLRAKRGLFWRKTNGSKNT